MTLWTHHNNPLAIAQPRTDAAWLRDHTGVTDSGEYFYLDCPTCGAAPSWRMRERGYTHEPRFVCHACGWNRWLSETDDEIAEAFAAFAWTEVSA